MPSTAPLIFRASAAHRTIAAVLSLGCLLVAGRGMPLMAQNLPRMWGQLKLAQSQGGEPTALIWLGLAAACAAVLIAGIAFALAVLALVLIEGTQILVDELGIAIECPLLPSPIARRLGAGRLNWESVASLERRGMRFVLRGAAPPDGPGKQPAVKFLVADQMERLILLIIERSPNLKLNI